MVTGDGVVNKKTVPTLSEMTSWLLGGAGGGGGMLRENTRTPCKMILGNKSILKTTEENNV